MKQWTAQVPKSQVGSRRLTKLAQDQLRARGCCVTRFREITAASVQNESDVEPQNVVRRYGTAKLASQTSHSRRLGMPRWFWYVWSAVFLIAGSIFLYILGVRPLWGMVQASGWVETPCTVIASELKEHPPVPAPEPGALPGPTYRTHILYRYEFRGGTYQSDRYDFVTMSSNTNVAKRRGIVKNYAPGKPSICFVNPANPAEAVLEPRMDLRDVVGVVPDSVRLAWPLWVALWHRHLASLHSCSEVNVGQAPACLPHSVHPASRQKADSCLPSFRGTILECPNLGEPTFLGERTFSRSSHTDGGGCFTWGEIESCWETLFATANRIGRLS